MAGATPLCWRSDYTGRGTGRRGAAAAAGARTQALTTAFRVDNVLHGEAVLEPEHVCAATSCRCCHRCLPRSSPG